MKKKYYWIIGIAILIILILFFFPKTCSEIYGDEQSTSKRECGCLGISGQVGATGYCYGICNSCKCYHRWYDEEGKLGDWKEVSCSEIIPR